MKNLSLDNERGMKEKGEARVYSTLHTKHGNLKQVASIQLAQQLIAKASFEISGGVREWINNTSGKHYRKELKDYYLTDEKLVEDIVTIHLMMAGELYISSENSFKPKAPHARYSVVSSLHKKVAPDMCLEVFWRLFEVIVEASPYFETESGWREWNKRYIKYTCTLSTEILETLAQEALLAFYPTPMLTPPIDWELIDDEVTGGYETYQYKLIRANFTNIDYSLYSKSIFDSINYIQSVPWVVNEELVAVVKKELKEPKREDFVTQEFPDITPCRTDLDLDAEDVKDRLSEDELDEILSARAIYREAYTLYAAEASDFESALGKYRAVKMAVAIAEQYIDADEIYFPHSYDFRGRIYPISIGLSPQGSDAVKAMIDYKNGEVLDERGGEWMWAYYASLWGDDKIPFQERVERGKELYNMGADYKEADEPYQFLSHQMQLKKWIDNPSHKVTARIHLDACNSGSQFTSAITADKIGCINTNVIPTINEDGTQTRQDAYLLVSDLALERTKELLKTCETHEEEEMLEFFKQLLETDGRKICKTPVMVSNYGGTAGGRSEILYNLFREMKVDRKWITKKVASRFSKIIGESIAGVLRGGKEFEIYIHKMNNIITRRSNKGIVWTTSDGFRVLHLKQKELSMKKVQCMLPGARRKTHINLRRFSNKVAPAKMKSAISPNYIHSLDAELLRRVALKLKKKGVDSDWIHDSFGSLPNHVDDMLSITKNEFRKMMMKKPLRVLDRELRQQADPSIKTQSELEEVSIPSLKGFSVTNGDLSIIDKSDWFFS